jgi:hypothetical protein
VTKPLQAPAQFAGIPDTTNFGRIIDVQEGIPLDGSNSNLRSYSPFVIRVVLPNILGGDSSNLLQTQRNPSRVPPSTTVRTDNRDSVKYSEAQGSSQVDPSGRSAYERLVNSGGALAGLTKASLVTLEDAYNQALVNQVFGPAVRNATRPPSNARNNTVTPALSNDITALSLAVQLKQMSEIPPLLMLINPSSMQTSYSKVAQHTARNRKGFLRETWGEEMPRITFTFKIGAYYAGRARPSQTNVVSGMQRASRNDSASYQQLQTMLSLFQGGTYLLDTTTNSRAFPLVGNLAIEYDQMVYVGHMENFTFTDDETHPHGGIDLSIEFAANKVYDVADAPGNILPMENPGAPRGQNRGALSRTGTGNSVSLFTVPGIGGTNPAAETANRAWQGATQPAPSPGQTSSVILTRRS